MSRQRDFWDALMSKEAPPDVIGYDRRLMTFPIGIKETFFESSEKFAGLQLADVLAGIVTECLTSKLVPKDERTNFQHELWNRFHGWDIAEHIWPEEKYSPSELGTDGPAATDGMVYMEEILRAAQLGKK